jgi:TrmH family RNA methyltransferase
LNDWKENVLFVLVAPAESGNIGASARALKNMGFKKLMLVNPAPHLNEEARQMACNAGDVLENARIYESLKDAVANAGLVVGTTRRAGKKKRLILPLAEGFQRIRETAEKNEVSILFGNERTGLTATEAGECAFLVSFPTDSADPSLNLAQSVLLAAYELSRSRPENFSRELVTKERLDEFFEELERILVMLEYAPRGDRDIEKKIMRNLKRILGRAGLASWELNLFRGICSQVEKRISKRKVRGA